MFLFSRSLIKKSKFSTNSKQHSNDSFHLDVSVFIWMYPWSHRNRRIYIFHSRSKFNSVRATISNQEHDKHSEMKIFLCMKFHFLHGQRDNTKWRLFYPTNIRISVFKTSYLLGAAETRLPNNFLSKESKRALTKKHKR